MPINRKEFDLVARYVNWDYRSRMVEFTTANEISYIGVDEYWQRTRETGFAHSGACVSSQCDRTSSNGGANSQDSVISFGLVPVQSKQTPIGGLPPASLLDILRLAGLRKHRFTPILVWLCSHPELFEKHGLSIELVSFQSGKTQGEALADGELDAWFSCAVPALLCWIHAKMPKLLPVLVHLARLH